MASLKKSELYRQAILSGNKDEAARLLNEINTEIASRYRQPLPPTPVKTILSDDHASAIDIYNFLNSHYKEEWWEWEIETLVSTLLRDFGQVVTTANLDKIQALKLLCNNQLPFSDWYYFNQVAVALAGAVADFEGMKYPSPGMAVACMRVMRLVRPDEEFGTEVKKFMTLVLTGDGIYIPPPTIFDILKDDFNVSIKDKWPEILARVQEMMDKKDYENDSDDVIDIQARRLLNVENAAETYGGR